MSTSAHQTSYDLMCDVLLGVLREAVRAGLGAAGIGSMQCRTVAVLYELLLDHPLDRRGRCRSCRRPGEVLGLRRRRCRVHLKAHFYLHHPDGAFLLGHLAREVGLPTPALAVSPGELADQGSDWCGQQTTSPPEPSNITVPMPLPESSVVGVPGSAGSTQREGCGGG